MREDYREFTGPPKKEKVTPHSVAIGLLIISSVVMLFLWFGDVMNHIAAKEQLEYGNYEEALIFDEEYSDAWYARFLDHKSRSMNNKELLRSINFAIKYAENPPSYWFLQRSFVYYAMDSSEKFKEDLITTKELRPNCDTAYYLLGDYYFSRGNSAKALSYFDSTLAIQPIHYQALYGKGLSHLKLNQFSKSVDAFSRCIEKEPQDRRCFFYRGSAKLGLKDTTSACSDLDQALTMGVDEAKAVMDASCGKQAN
jgi:tetratricopeptide (TPR) repeat protein